MQKFSQRKDSMDRKIADHHILLSDVICIAPSVFKSSRTCYYVSFKKHIGNFSSTIQNTYIFITISLIEIHFSFLNSWRLFIGRFASAKEWFISKQNKCKNRLALSLGRLIVRFQFEKSLVFGYLIQFVKCTKKLVKETSKL